MTAKSSKKYTQMNLSLSPATAKHVEAVERRYTCHDGILRYTVSMAAVGVVLTHHLRAELRSA